jgi:hypothetical protein
MRLRALPLALAFLILLGACSRPTSEATPEIRSQYITVARIAAERTNLDISDEDWLKFADLVCSRKILSDADYDELIAEIETGAPTPELGRAARDVGQSAISLFCPPEL